MREVEIQEITKEQKPVSLTNPALFKTAQVFSNAYLDTKLKELFLNLNQKCSRPSRVLKL
jgi:hypothetical protein